MFCVRQVMHILRVPSKRVARLCFCPLSTAPQAWLCPRTPAITSGLRVHLTGALWLAGVSVQHGPCGHLLPAGTGCCLLGSAALSLTVTALLSLQVVLKAVYEFSKCSSASSSAVSLSFCTVQVPAPQNIFLLRQTSWVSWAARSLDCSGVRVP